MDHERSKTSELFGNLKTDWQLVPGPWVYVYKKKLDLKKKARFFEDFR